MALQANDASAGYASSDPSQEILYVEDLLLLSRYDEAAMASLTLVSRFSEGGNRADAFFQRAVVAALQAHFFSGRQGMVEAIVENIGLKRLTVPTFAAWILLLLESGQAGPARLLVERYMTLLTTLTPTPSLSDTAGGGRAGIPAHPGTPQPGSPFGSTRATDGAGSSSSGHGDRPLLYSCRTSTDAGTASSPRHGSRDGSPLATEGAAAGSPSRGSKTNSPGGSMRDGSAAAVAAAATGCPLPESPGSPALYDGGGGGADGRVGAAAATLQDRAALARLYSQDVLSLGLHQPQEALGWLGSPSSPPSPEGSQRSQPSSQPSLQPEAAAAAVAAGVRKSKEGGVAGGSGGGGGGVQGAEGRQAGVLGAPELVACEQTLRVLRRELHQLLEASGLLPRRASGDEGSNGSANGATGATNGNGNGHVGVAAAIRRSSLESGGKAGLCKGGKGGLCKGGKAGPALMAAAVATATATPNGRRDSGSGRAGSGSGSGANGSSGDSNGRTGVTGKAPSRSDARAAASASAATAVRPETGLLRWIPVSTASLGAILRDLLAAAYDAVRRLTSLSYAQLTRGQAWLVCKAAAAVSRLREAAAAAAAVVGGPASSYRQYGNLALVLAAAVVAAVAMSAEAPHLRAVAQARWSSLAGLVREVVGMAMAMHPSPVAAPGIVRPSY